MIQHHDKKAAERHGSTLAAAAFETWLRQRIEADGHSLTAIAAAAGVDYQALRNPLIGRTARPTLSNVRLLALHFGDDPEEIAALAGYPNPRATCPEPSEFSTFDGWLRAVLQVRHETRRHASVAAGLSEHVCRHILAGQPPEWNTVALLARYFGVQPTAPLFALAGYRSQEARDADLLVRALEDKRSRDHLLHQDVINALEISKRAYWGRYQGKTRLRLDHCARIARWLDRPVSEVLAWEYGERLCAVGKIVAPTALERGYKQNEFSRVLGVGNHTLNGVLWGSKCPSEQTINKLSEQLDLDAADLHRARLEMLERRDPRPTPFHKKIQREGRPRSGPRWSDTGRSLVKATDGLLDAEDPRGRGDHR